ncbi:5-formyltetrahydrofolate cyclo-ligase [Mycoplasma sp. HU2014]|uniref:5-formyltetrahydrofolate cyclo-ligase n=1 Tax=Mycoplasma sp. HU2014 TaxID=1664275 RepID=UPI00067E0945|nr:5-formyltetrahydrofolate cyclo-ligase [Mycoplasma sp. HU2014]KNG79507.1 5-formyltetrahydrofolate cyclo-ligase [Mycoplasma sp. HU2014]
MNKSKLRQEMLEKRKNFSNTYIDSSNLIITSKVIEFIKENNFKNICIYLSTKYEVETRKIIDYCFLNNIKVFVPRVLENNDMEMIRYLDHNHNNLNKFNIQEPISDEIIEINELDCIFTPLVGFDKNLNRIGMGKGFYDKFFNLNKNNYLKVGLSFDEQLIGDYILKEQHDVKLDTIITEKFIYN